MPGERREPSPPFLPEGSELEPVFDAPHVAELKEVPDTEAFKKFNQEFPEGVFIKRTKPCESSRIENLIGGSIAESAVFTDSEKLVWAAKTELEMDEPTSLLWYRHRELPPPASYEQLKAILEGENTTISPNLRETLKGKVQPGIYPMETLRELYPPMLHKVATRLQERYEMQRTFFKDELPNFVPRTQYLIAAPGETSLPQIYNIQEKVDTYFNLSDYIWKQVEVPDFEREGFARVRVHDIDEASLVDALKKAFSPEKLEVVYKQIRTLQEKMRQFSEQKGGVIDLVGSHNLSLSAEGELHFIDVETIFNLYDKQESEGESRERKESVAKEILDHTLSLFDRVVGALERSDDKMT